MINILTFGEALIRLAPPSFERLEQASNLKVTVGGSELTVAAGLCRMGLRAAWVSCLPNNPLGRIVRNKAREQGVDVSNVVWNNEERLGIYFVEYGASPRASTVLYDRANSAFSHIGPGDIDWPKLLSGVNLFHTSGITPALSDSAAIETEEALKAAKMNDCLVSYDLNYRTKLWSQEKAQVVQTPLMKYVDILFTTEEDTERVFGVKRENYKNVAIELAEKFGFKVVTITLRSNPSVWHNTWSAIAYSEGTFYDDVTYAIEIVDRVGGGDNYTAGFLYGYLTKGVRKGVRYGNAFSALKQTSWGDMNWTTLEEVENLLKGKGMRISR